MENRRLTYSIREAVPDDLDELVRMRIALQVHMEQRNPHIWKIAGDPELQFRDRCLQVDFGENSRVVVATQEGNERLVAMASGSILEQNRMAPLRYGRINDVWVEPEHRRNGVCRRLILALLSFYKKAGIDALTLNFVSGNHEARETWLRLGFTPVVVMANAPLETVRRRCLTGGDSGGDIDVQGKP